MVKALSLGLKNMMAEQHSAAESFEVNVCISPKTSTDPVQRHT